MDIITDINNDKSDNNFNNLVDYGEIIYNSIIRKNMKNIWIILFY
jgi:hypothetical protein